MPPSNHLLSAKIVVREEAPRIRNIPGAQTSLSAFAGVTERGPVRTPTFVTSFEEFVDVFGGYIAASDLAVAVEGFFLNGGTAAWITRIVHYTDITDASTQTAVVGDQDIDDRGGAAAAAILDSAAGPFDLEPNEVLEINIDGGGADTLTFTATGATGTAAAGLKNLSGNDKTFIFVVKAPGETVAEESFTITFVDADFVDPANATHQEIVNAINARGGPHFIYAELATALAKVSTSKRGTGASMVITGTAGAILGGTLVNATLAGAGNVADIDSVTHTEIAALLTALTIASGTATAITGNKVRLASTATGAGADVVVTANTTAGGIFAGALPITEVGTAAAVSATLNVAGKYPGTWIGDYSVKIEASTDGDSDHFNLILLKGTATVETWPNLSMTDADERYVETIINHATQGSAYIVATDLDSGAATPSDLPALGTYVSWVNDDDGLVGLVDSDFSGSEADGTGLYAFDEVEDIRILCVPGRATSAVHNAMITYCETQRVGSTFAILDPPEGETAQTMKTYVETTAALYNLSEFAAIYWPNVKILNPSRTEFGYSDTIVVPPSGHIAGMYVRTDTSVAGGVFQSPAGVERGRLFGIIGLETDEVLNERKRDVVFPSRINPITLISGSPRHVDGARTLKGDSSFPYIGERRGVIFIEQSIKRALLFAKQRANDRKLRMEVQRTIQAFLLRQFSDGAFRGATPSESFFVDVSDAINTPERIFAGELHVRIGLATQKPAEFIVLTFTQDTRALEERIASAT